MPARRLRVTWLSGVHLEPRGRSSKSAASRAKLNPLGDANPLLRRLLNRRLFPVWQASYQDEKATWSMLDLKAHVVGDVETMSGLALASVALVWLMERALNVAVWARLGA